MNSGESQEVQAAGPEGGAPAANRSGAHPSKWWLLAVVIVIAASLRFFGLDHPAEVYFDETYYANDAVVYLEGPDAFRHNLDELYGGTSRETEIIPVGAEAGEISWVHPPLGKWFIAAGIAALGKNPWGWRSMAVIFGIGTVAATYLLALVLWRRHSWAFLAGLLVAIDGLAIVESRVAMLDGFVSTLIIVAFLFAACEKRRMEKEASAAWTEFDGHPLLGERHVEWVGELPAGEGELPAGEWPADEWAAGEWAADESPAGEWAAGESPAGEGEWAGESPAGERVRWRRLWVSKWRVLTGLALGAAIATKWSGLWAILVIGALFVAWTLTTRLPGNSYLSRLVSAAPSLITCLVLLPVLIYIASYAGWFASNSHGSILSNPDRVASEFVKMQVDTLKYHRSLNASHPYQSTPGTWPLMSRPIAYWYQELPDGDRGHVLAVGNPGIWWPFLAVVPLVLAFGLARRDWRDALILGGYFGLYLPWFANPRTAFFYYMTPVVPFMALTLVSAARRAPDTLRPAAAIVITGLAVVGCVLFYPIWTGIPISSVQWNNLMLFPSWI